MLTVCLQKRVIIWPMLTYLAYEKLCPQKQDEEIKTTREFFMYWVVGKNFYPEYGREKVGIDKQSIEKTIKNFWITSIEYKTLTQLTLYLCRRKIVLVSLSTQRLNKKPTQKIPPNSFILSWKCLECMNELTFLIFIVLKFILLWCYKKKQKYFFAHSPPYVFNAIHLFLCHTFTNYYWFFLAFIWKPNQFF